MPEPRHRDAEEALEEERRRPRPPGQADRIDRLDRTLEALVNTEERLALHALRLEILLPRLEQLANRVAAVELLERLKEANDR